MLLKVIFAVVCSLLMAPVVEKAKETAKFFGAWGAGLIGWKDPTQPTSLVPVLKDIRETTTPVHAFLGITTAIYLTIFVLQWLTRRIACSRGASKSETSLCAQYEETTKVQDEAMVGDNDDATSTVTGGYSASSEFVPSSSGSNQSLASTVLDVDSASGTDLGRRCSSVATRSRSAQSAKSLPYAASEVSLPCSAEGDAGINEKELHWNPVYTTALGEPCSSTSPLEPPCGQVDE
ncbi:uncharacterized protein LOC144100703 [Amblyomma americanum]